jgi:predicted MPP superfamily phosphohydrolase
LPDSDFAVSFNHIAEQAIAVNADVFLLAEDLFDRPQVEPPHLRQAENVLAKLKKARIPVIAIAGNHDKAFINAEEETWLGYTATSRCLPLAPEDSTSRATSKYCVTYVAWASTYCPNLEIVEIGISLITGLIAPGSSPTGV